MLSRRVDAALQSMRDCRERVPFLRDQYRPGSAERAALDELLDAHQRANAALERFLTDPTGACC